jgi:hypothetical protein
MLWMDNQALGPTMPIWYIASSILCVVPILLSNNYRIRVLSCFLLMIIAVLTIIRFINYSQFEQKVKYSAFLTSSLDNIYPKIINYNEQHPTSSISNISDYIQAKRYRLKIQYF